MPCLSHSSPKKEHLAKKLNIDLFLPFPENDLTPFETALASVVQKEDIEVLVGSFLFELHQIDTCFFNRAGLPEKKKDTTSAFVYDFWELVLTGKSKNKNFTSPVKLSFSKENKEYWLMIFNKLIEAHFCGTVLQLLKNKIRQNLPGFLYHWNMLQKLN